MSTGIHLFTFPQLVAKNIQGRAFTTWLDATRSRVSARESLLQRADSHYCHTLLRSCLSAWLTHHAGWKKHWLALMHHHTHLERNFFRKWHEFAVQQARMQELNKIAIIHAARLKIRTAFSGWRACVVQRAEREQAQEIAVLQARSSIMTKY